MKLFGGKKGGRHSKDVVNTVASEEALEVMEAEEPVVEEHAELAAQSEIPEITNASVIEIYSAEEVAEAEKEQTEEQAVEQEQSGEEDGLISSIAEAFGISAEDMQKDLEEPVVSEAADNTAAAAETGKKKLSRAEKKAAKQAEKEAEKARKAAIKAAKKEARKWSLGKKIVAVLVLIMALGITAFAGYFVSEMWVGDDQLDIYEADFTGDVIRADDANITDYNSDSNVQTVPVDETRKDGCYTFLVAARDVASGCTDVIIVGRFDTKKHTINMVSIPRDTMINKGNLKVNTAYQGDLASGGNGVDGLLKEMKKILGFDIDSYAIVDIEAVAKLIDAIGGVYFDVPMDMKYDDASQHLHINIKKGYQKLSGEDAVKVMRFRKGYANGDLGRIQTQHDFIKALAEQILDVGNIPNLGAAIEIYQEHVQTNLSAGNILFYAKHFLDMNMDDIQFVDMPQMMGGLVNGQSFIFINPTKWITVINEYLNPYKEDITQKNVNIKSSADQGETFFYTGG